MKSIRRQVKSEKKKKYSPRAEEKESEYLKDIFIFFHFIYKDKIRNKQMEPISTYTVTFAQSK